MDEIEQVKSKIDIVDLIGGYVTLKRAGRNFKGLCPFHGEKSPSFMVSSELQIYKCFGCQKGGDAFSFIQEIENLEFGEALGLLAEKAGIKLEHKFDKQSDTKTELIKIQELTAEYYHFLLTRHKTGIAAKTYLRERKIGDKLIEEFRIGFSLPSWDGLYKYLVEKKKINVEMVEKTGMIVRGKQGYYDRFRGRVVFPLTDTRGRVIAFAGRVVPGIEEMPKGALSGFDAPKYINSPETPVYHKSETLFGFFQAKAFIKKADRVILVEGELDMISSFAAGIGETVAIKGSALTEEQVLMIRRLTRNIIMALDADEAGQAAMKRGIEIAEAQGMNIKIVVVEGGKDPDDIARNSPSKWKEMLTKAVDVYEFYIQSAHKKNNVKTIEGKRRFGEEVFPILNRIENKVVRSFYIHKVADLLEVGEESVAAEIERMGRAEEVKYHQVQKKEEAEIGKNQEEMIEVDLLSVILAAKTDTSLIWTKDLLKDGVEGVVTRILALWWKNQGKLQVTDFINTLPSELKQTAQEAYLKEELFEDLERNFKETKTLWLKLTAKKKLAKISEEIKKAENGADQSQMGDLEKEFMEWTKRLALANRDGG